MGMGASRRALGKGPRLHPVFWVQNGIWRAVCGVGVVDMVRLCFPIAAYSMYMGMDGLSGSDWCTPGGLATRNGLSTHRDQQGTGIPQDIHHEPPSSSHLQEPRLHASPDDGTHGKCRLQWLDHESPGDGPALAKQVSIEEPLCHMGHWRLESESYL